MNTLERIIRSVSLKSRRERAALFRRQFTLDETTRILDVGSESGENIKLVLEGAPVKPENVCIADLDARAVERGHHKYGFRPVGLEESGALPFEDDYFDIVYCSSVIEHVAVSKKNVWQSFRSDEFDREAWEKQKRLAGEIRRVGRRYFVQTPARSFPLESHTWLPFFSFLPRRLQVRMMRLTNKFWVKQALPDFRLLDEKEMRELFPEAEIVLEKKLGLVKSIMAIKK